MHQKSTKYLYLPYIMLIPAFLFLLIFLAYPLFEVFRLSMQSYSIARLSEKGFIGFRNFAEIFTKDKTFPVALQNSLRWVLGTVVLQLISGFIIALILEKKFRGRTFARSVVFLPWALSGVVTAMIWSLMYNQNMGVMNNLLKQLGIINKDVAWLAGADIALRSAILSEVWRGIPFFAITILASLQNISPDLYEACRSDGGKPWQEILYIKLPMLKETIILTTFILLIFALAYLRLSGFGKESRA